LVVCALSLFYAWSLYNIPILAVGVKHLRETVKKRTTVTDLGRQKLPTISIIVPVKDEEKVIGRLLTSLLKLDYPPEKKDIIVVEDGSTDETGKICAQYAAQHSHQIRLIHQLASNGKPSALNCALRHVRGEIVAVFDSDSVLEPDALLNTVEYFEDPSIAAVQGRPCSINADENMLSRLISYEESVRYETYLRGKDVLNLFVPLTGSCYFVRKSVLDEVGGWDNDSLSEDMELSARLTKVGHNIRYASNVCSWQENPATLRQLLRQRIRWFRGCMEVSLKFWKLLRSPSRTRIDAEITLLGPFMFVPILLGYLLGIYDFFGSVQLDFLSAVMSQGTTLLTTTTLFLIGVALLCATRPRKKTNLLWLPFVYAYLSLQSFIALYALIQIVFKRPRRWIRTAKTGVNTNHVV
jgi:cellulose synthase/poly-beta-1,6-N-acetylglucosamine synthase-like glycosyltransferase